MKLDSKAPSGPLKLVFRASLGSQCTGAPGCDCAPDAKGSCTISSAMAIGEMLAPVEVAISVGATSVRVEIGPP